MRASLESKNAADTERSGAAGMQRQGRSVVDNRPGAVAQRQLAEMMNSSPRVVQQKALADTIFHSPRMVAQRRKMNAFSGDGQTRSAPIQRVVDVGPVSYTAPGGNATKALVVRIQQTLKTAGKDLKPGWITALKRWVKNAPLNEHNYPTEDDLLAALEVQFPPTATVSSAKKRKADIEQQDQNLVALTTGIDDRERKRAKLLTTHSSKAWNALVSDVSKRKTVTDTSDELEALNAGVMDTTSNVQSTSVPFEFLAALGSSGAGDNLDRMDFNFGGTEVSSHGFESPGDRSIAPRGKYTTKKGKTKSFNAFNYNTVKIGNNIGTYAKHQGAQPSAFQGAPFMTLNSLEKFRLPGQALGTSIKRDLMNQGLFTTPQGIGQNHPHANVEFLGATAGSGLTRQQQEHMRDQQELSNTNILNSAYATAPNQALGLDTRDGKSRTTPSAIYNQLDVVMASDADDLATKTAKKRELRRKVKRALASAEGLMNIDSDDEVSDAEP